MTRTTRTRGIDHRPLKAEEIWRRGPWKKVAEVEFATLEWAAWYNTQLLLQPLGYVSSDELERAYYHHQRL